VQSVGVEGGTNLMGIDMSLKSQDPQRYSALQHPGDAYAYDIFSQAGRLARNEEVLRGLRAEDVIAVDLAAGVGDPTAEALHHADALRASARRLGRMLAHRLLGAPGPSEDGVSVPSRPMVRSASPQ